MRDQLEGLLERVEIDVMSNSGNVVIRKVKREGGREGEGKKSEGGRDENSHFYNFAGSHSRVFLPHCTTLEGRSLQDKL